MMSAMDASSAYPSAVDLADLLLAHLASGGASSAAVEPGEVDYVVRIDAGEGYVARATLPRALGNAVAVRLAIVADVPLTTDASAVGRFRVALRQAASGTQPPTTDFVLAVRTTVQGSPRRYRLAQTAVRARCPAAIPSDEAFGSTG